MTPVVKEAPLISKYVSCVKSPIVDGTDMPEFPLTSKDVSCVSDPIVVGIVDNSALNLSSKAVSCVNIPIVDGKSPDSWFESSFNTASCVKNPSVNGIFPVKELLPRSKTVSCVKSPISEGILPRRLCARNSNLVVAWGSQSSPKNLTVEPSLMGFGVGRGVVGGTVAGGMVFGEGVSGDICKTGEGLVGTGPIVGVPNKGTGPVGAVAVVGPKIVGGDPKIGDTDGVTEGTVEGTGEDDGVAGPSGLRSFPSLVIGLRPRKPTLLSLSTILSPAIVSRGSGSCGGSSLLGAKNNDVRVSWSLSDPRMNKSSCAGLGDNEPPDPLDGLSLRWWGTGLSSSLFATTEANETRRRSTPRHSACFETRRLMVADWLSFVTL